MSCTSGAEKIMIGIIGGSGLDNPEILANRTEKTVTTPYGDPSDALIVGDIEGVPVAILARHGRKHGVMPGKVNYRANIWALRDIGCTHIVATNACGSLAEEIVPGSLVIIDNFIDRTHNRKQTFYDGEPGHPPGMCHLPMEPAFCPHLRKLILETSKSIGLDARDGGVVVAIEGPRFSSKAESNMYQQWGAHVVGMTTVPEVVLAKEAGLPYAAIAMATDYDCWRDTGEKVSHKHVLATFKQNVEKVIKLLRALIPRMAKEDWSKTLAEAQELAKESVYQET